MFAITKYAFAYAKRRLVRHTKVSSYHCYMLTWQYRIINNISVVTFCGSSSMVDYASTKGAIVGFTRSLALPLAPKGICVNSVA